MVKLYNNKAKKTSKTKTQQKKFVKKVKNKQTFGLTNKKAVLQLKYKIIKGKVL